MDLNSVAFPALAAVVSMFGLWWHLKQAREGKATFRDRAMGGMWAAMLVLAGGRVIWMLMHPPEATPAGTPPVATEPPAADPAKTK